MATEILMPALSPTMEEGTLAKWLVKEGDTVASGDLLAEIETDKATVDFEAQDDGVVAKILVEAGNETKVGTPVMVTVDDAKDVDAFKDFKHDDGAPPPPPPPPVVVVVLRFFLGEAVLPQQESVHDFGGAARGPALAVERSEEAREADPRLARLRRPHLQRHQQRLHRRILLRAAADQDGHDHLRRP